MNSDIYELADKLESFAQDYDTYNYMDYADMDEDILDMLKDKDKVQGIIDYLEEAAYEMDESSETYNEVKSMLSDLEEIQESLRVPSLEERLLKAEQESNLYNETKDTKTYDDLEL